MIITRNGKFVYGECLDTYLVNERKKNKHTKNVTGEAVEIVKNCITVTDS